MMVQPTPCPPLEVIQSDLFLQLWLIKNCIICWNYLYLAQKLADLTDQTSREVLLKALTQGSAVAWQHLNLLGEYDFSEERLQDTVGIKLPELTD